MSQASYSWILAMALMLLQAAPLVARAQTTTTTAGTTAPAGALVGGRLPEWMGKDYDVCNQVCMVNKADGMLSLIEYNRSKRFSALAQLASDFNDKNRKPDKQIGEDNAQLRQELTGMCSDGDPRQCYVRWAWGEMQLMRKSAMILRTLKQARKDLATDGNPDSKARSKSLTNAIEYVSFLRQKEGMIKSQTAYVPTYDEVKKQYDEDTGRLRQLTREDYNDYANLLLTPPDCREYVEMKSAVIAGKPAMIVAENPDGTPKLDAGACARAKTMFAKYKTRFEKTILDPNGEKAKMAADEQRTRLKMAGLEKKSIVTVDAFRDSQQSAVGVVNDEMAREAVDYRKRNGIKADAGKSRAPAQQAARGNAKVKPILIGDDAQTQSSFSFMSDTADEKGNRTSAIDGAVSDIDRALDRQLGK